MKTQNINLKASIAVRYVRLSLKEQSIKELRKRGDGGDPDIHEKLCISDLYEEQTTNIQQLRDSIPVYEVKDCKTNL